MKDWRYVGSKKQWTFKIARRLFDTSSVKWIYVCFYVKFINVNKKKHAISSFNVRLRSAKPFKIANDAILIVSVVCVKSHGNKLRIDQVCSCHARISIEFHVLMTTVSTRSNIQLHPVPRIVGLQTFASKIQPKMYLDDINSILPKRPWNALWSSQRLAHGFAICNHCYVCSG